MSENSPDARRQVDHTWIAAAAVVVLVVAGLVWIVMRRNDSTPPSPAPSASSVVTSSATSGSAPPPAAATPSATTAATASAWPDAGCNGSAAPPVAPQSAMTDLRWEPFLTSAIPISPTIGPAKTSGANGALRQCFEHSPAGALVAAANIALGQFVPGTGRAVVETQFVAGPGRDKALKDLTTSSGQPGQIVAFKLNGCTAAACNVDLVFFGRGAYGSAVVPMVWTNGDWYVDGSQRIPDGGLVQGIPAGFTAWGST